MDPNALITRIEQDHLALLASGGPSLHAALPPQAVWVRGHPAPLAPVIGNLIDKAAQLTVAGG